MKIILKYLLLLGMLFLHPLFRFNLLIIPLLILFLSLQLEGRYLMLYLPSPKPRKHCFQRPPSSNLFHPLEHPLQHLVLQPKEHFCLHHHGKTFGHFYRQTYFQLHFQIYHRLSLIQSQLSRNAFPPLHIHLLIHLGTLPPSGTYSRPLPPQATGPGMRASLGLGSEIRLKTSSCCCSTRGRENLIPSFGV